MEPKLLKDLTAVILIKRTETDFTTKKKQLKKFHKYLDLITFFPK